MARSSLNFDRLIPVGGYEFDAFGPATGEDGDAANIYLRPKRMDEAIRLSVEDVAASLKRHIERRQSFAPFSERQEEIRDIRTIEDACRKKVGLLSVWSDERPQILQIIHEWAVALAQKKIGSEPQRDEEEWPRILGETMHEVKSEHSALIDKRLASHKRLVKWKRKTYDTLFIRFAAIQPSPTEILKFANTYGNLRDVCNLLLWHDEVLAMRRAVQLWELLKKIDSSDPKGEMEDAKRALRKHFRLLSIENDRRGNQRADLYYAGQCVVLDSHPQLSEGIQAKFPDMRTLETIEFHEIRHPCTEDTCKQVIDEVRNGINASHLARVYISRAIQRHTDEHASSQLYWENGVMSRRMGDHDLLGALWLQFEEAVSGIKEIRHCSVCGDPFEVSREANKSTRETCSNACRFSKYRARIKQAIELRSAGKSLKEIAKVLDTDVKTVKGWVSQVQQGE